MKDNKIDFKTGIIKYISLVILNILYLDIITKTWASAEFLLLGKTIPNNRDTIIGTILSLIISMLTANLILNSKKTVHAGIIIMITSFVMLIFGKEIFYDFFTTLLLFGALMSGSSDKEKYKYDFNILKLWRKNEQK